MITEFYVKGEDSGLPNTTGAGWVVPTQTDRGRFYQHYILGLLQSGNCVGWHWFKYQDNDPDDPKAGAVEHRFEQRHRHHARTSRTETFLQMMADVNREVYPLTEFFDR